MVPRSEPDPDAGMGGSRGGWAVMEMRGGPRPHPLISLGYPRSPQALSLAVRGNVPPPPSTGRGGHTRVTPTVDFVGRGGSEGR